MNPQQAIDMLDPNKWKATSAQRKLELLKQIRKNLKVYMQELFDAECQAKNIKHGNKDTLHMEYGALQTLITPIASNVSVCIELYKSLIKGKMPGPISIEKVTDDLYDVCVFPKYPQDKFLYFDRKDILRIKGEPTQVNPLRKEGGITAVLGAGNYSSAFEIIRALFIDNCVVVHKAHPINAKTDAVWEKILKPLADFKALSFCDVNQGQELVKDPRLTRIYFTGGTDTAKAIMASTSTELVSECGGNNPCIVVPGDEPWSKSQIKHHAVAIATINKINGGAVCGRFQTIVTCKNWPQRKEFLDALYKALEEDTPAFESFYPNTDKVFDEFKKNYPDAKVIEPKDNTVPNSKILFIEDVKKNSFAATHEAFCQVVDEVALDTSTNADEFLKKAVEFCNTKLLGTLCVSILIDDKSAKKYKKELDEAITKLEYGAIGINLMAPMIWMNPYLTWGGNEEGKELVSGRGNFGNTLSFENVQKSIAFTPFISPGHFKATNKSVFAALSRQMALYTINPTWGRIAVMSFVMLTGALKGKDF